MAKQGPPHPAIASHQITPLPLVLRDQIPNSDLPLDVHRVDLNETPEQWYLASAVDRYKWWVKTPEGFRIKVSIPSTDIAHWRAASGEWKMQKDNDLWQCTAHALQTWKPETRQGYVIDLTEGMWWILNDLRLATVIMKPTKLGEAFEPLREALQAGDIFVIWEHEKLVDGKLVSAIDEETGCRPCCHAVRILEPAFTLNKTANVDGGRGTLDVDKTIVTSKNGRGPVIDVPLSKILAEKDYQGRAGAIYRLGEGFRTPLKNWAACECERCEEYAESKGTA